MNIADTMGGFVRRWYIAVPGIILALVAGFGTFIAVQPGHQRTSTQLLLPGSGTIPVGTTNPYLFLGGLTQAADIVVRVMRSDEVLGPIVKDYPGTDVLVERDPTVSGPVIQITVTGKTDAATEDVLAALIDETKVELDRLQTQQKVKTDDRISVSTLTLDTQSTLQQKTRILISAGVALGLVVLTLIVASLIDGLARRPHKAGRRGGRGRVKGDARRRRAAPGESSQDELLDPIDDDSADDGPAAGEIAPTDPAPEEGAEPVPDTAGRPGFAERPRVPVDDTADESDRSDRSDKDAAPAGETVGAGRGRTHHRAARRT
ncbi:hypothetical protein [Microbacterium capsulatum]|uniref:Capsular polysaccharide biosynthesis protein n=1 Tax=Microbacterium capsulatum TaxID=3041921 RepID=A0ABU0XGL4_9MICO|nr:hypothetical protein [Microbacterium sp. ASV81]MDQ4214268.1 hypothetical protein [Microbacterium sp. ASV81]